jgi:hypothetical protein
MLPGSVAIELGKGVVYSTRGMPIDDAFDIFRSYARRHRMQLSVVAAMLVRLELDLGAG